MYRPVLISLCALVLTVPMEAQFSKLKEAAGKIKAPTAPSGSGNPVGTAVPGGAAAPVIAPKGKDPADKTEAAGPAGPMLLKYTLQANPRATGDYYPTPKSTSADVGLKAWAPRFEFSLLGPIVSGTQIVLEAAHSNGKPWATLNCGAPTEIPANAVQHFKCGEGFSDKEGTTDSGMMPFKVIARNELQGSNTVLYEGVVKVDKFILNPTNYKDYARNYQYYSDNDWRLPYAWIAQSHEPNMDFANLLISVVLKGKVRNAEGYLFYNGKQVGQAMTANHPFSYKSPGEDRQMWTEYKFYFTTTVRVWSKDSSTHFNLAKNDGAYEFKVLRDGKLARVAKFQVQGGKIVDEGGMLKQPGIAGTGPTFKLLALVPAQVLGDTDGEWSKDMYKQSAFFGQPVAGFEVR